MNNKTTKSIVAVLVAAAVIGGIYYWATNKSGAPGTTPAPGTVKPADAPVVKTKAVSFVSQSTAVLNGEVNPNGAQTSYWYEYGTTQSLGSVAGAQLLGAGYAKYQAPTYITGLNANTTYYFRIVAVNSVGRSAGSILSFTTNNTPPPPYNSPMVQTNSADDITMDSAVLNGDVNPKGSGTIYWFEYGAAPGLGNATVAKSAGGGTNDLPVSAEISGLQADKVYYFRLNAQNAYGTNNGAIRSFRTKSATPLPQSDRPTAETNSATNITQTTAILNGQVDSKGGQGTFYFEYGRATLLGTFTLDQRTEDNPVSDGEFVDVSDEVTGLDSNTTYYFRLVAENQYGSDAGAIYSFKTAN